MAPPMLDPAPRLSVVIPTTHGLPDVALPLDSMRDQAHLVGAEVIVADGGARPPPPDDVREGLVWLRAPGATVFELRAMGIAHARGDVIAVTEDHVQVAPDYCEQVLRAHRDAPEALMIGGVVENGSLDPVGLASYFMGNIDALPPERGSWTAPLTGQANISYKRRLLEAYAPATLQSARLRGELEARGLARNDPGVKVLHIQSLGVAGSCLHHFHDGRYVASCRRGELAGRRLAFEVMKNLALPARVPFAAARVVVRNARRYPSMRREILVSAPMLALLMGFHCAGELAGILAGPGDSARHIP